MTPRSIRRSQEREARKLARKQARLNVLETPEIETGLCTDNCDQQLTSTHSGFTEASSDFDAPASHGWDNYGSSIPSAVDAAPQPQPGRSTGPKTPQGKAKSCLNAVKTGLTGRTVLLPSDDADRYQQHIADFLEELQPVGPRESALVQSIADGTWRLERISTLEMALFARGREEFAELFADRDPALRSSLTELHTLLTYEKQIRNLNIQEARLRRQREKDSAELRGLQHERRARERAELETAAKMYLAAKKEGKSFNPAELGFDFSIDDVIAFIDRVRNAGIAREAMRNEVRAAVGRSMAA